LTAGVYEVEMRTGAASDQRLINIRDVAEFHAPQLGLGIDTPIPVSGAARRDYRAGEAATMLSSALLASGGRSGLVLLLMGDADATDEPPPRSRQEQICVLSSTLAPVEAFDGLAAPRGTSSGKAAVLDEGGYLLRHSTFRREVPDVDVPVWICAGFQTLVIIPCRPEPRLDLMSVHMTPIDQLWTGFDDSANALELALHGLRGGRLLISQQNLCDIASLIARNPMLGLVISHAIAADPARESLRRGLLEVLANVIPSHPDVLALSSVPVTMHWPPSLSAGYQMALRAEAQRSVTIGPGTLAETASRELLLHGPWTAWRSSSTVASDPSAPAAVWHLPGVSLAAIAAPIPTALVSISRVGLAVELLAPASIRIGQLLPKLRAVLALRDRSAPQLVQLLADLNISDHAEDRVRQYLGSIVSLSGDRAFRSLRKALLGSSRPVALATSLPVTLARTAIVDIARKILAAVTTRRRGPFNTQTDQATWDNPMPGGTPTL
jgi:hypothetical protein